MWLSKGLMSLARIFPAEISSIVFKIRSASTFVTPYSFKAFSIKDTFASVDNGANCFCKTPPDIANAIELITS